MDIVTYALSQKNIEKEIPKQVGDYCEEHFSEWEGALDDTLQETTMAAPAKTVGDALTTLNNALTANRKTMQMLEADGSADWNVVEYEMGTIALNGDMSPSTASIRTKGFIRVYGSCTIHPTNGYRYRVIRYNADGTYHDGEGWLSIDKSIDDTYIYKLVINKEGVDPATTSDSSNVVIYRKTINNFPYVSVTSSADLDLNACKKGALAFSGSAAPANYPSSLGSTYGRTHILFTFRKNNVGMSNGDTQLLIQSGIVVARRDYQSGSWGSWTNINTTDFINNNTVISSADAIDVNSLKNGVYGFIASVVPNNLPTRSYGGENLIITVRVSNTSLANFDKQILICNGSMYAHRQYYNGAWTNWVLSDGNKTLVVDVNGGGNYTSLTACIKYINDSFVINWFGIAYKTCIIISNKRNIQGTHI